MKTQNIDTGKVWEAVDSATPTVVCGHLLSRGQSVLVTLDDGEILYARSGSNFDAGVLAFTA